MVSPAAEAPVGVLPVFVVRRQIPPERSGQGTPVRKIQDTASMNRRLSWAGLPCLPSPPGRCGLNRSQTSSVIPWRRCAARILPTLPTRSNPSPSHGLDDTPSLRRRVPGFPRTSIFLMQGQRRWRRWGVEPGVAGQCRQLCGVISEAGISIVCSDRLLLGFLCKDLYDLFSLDFCMSTILFVRSLLHRVP